MNGRIRRALSFLVYLDLGDFLVGIVGVGIGVMGIGIGVAGVMGVAIGVMASWA
ncbi:MAG: hypothetical protein ACRDSL_22090 [Pseudonocardiaceae bacterium]